MDRTGQEFFSMSSLNDSSMTQGASQKIVKIFLDSKHIKTKKLNLDNPLASLRAELNLPVQSLFVIDGMPIDLSDEIHFTIADTLFNVNEIHLQSSQPAGSAGPQPIVASGPQPQSVATSFNLIQTHPVVQQPFPQNPHLDVSLQAKLDQSLPIPREAQNHPIGLVQPAPTQIPQQFHTPQIFQTNQAVTGIHATAQHSSQNSSQFTTVPHQNTLQPIVQQPHFQNFSQNPDPTSFNASHFLSVQPNSGSLASNPYIGPPVSGVVPGNFGIQPTPTNPPVQQHIQPTSTAANILDQSCNLSFSSVMTQPSPSNLGIGFQMPQTPPQVPVAPQNMIPQAKPLPNPVSSPAGPSYQDLFSLLQQNPTLAANPGFMQMLQASMMASMNPATAATPTPNAALLEASKAAEPEPPVVEVPPEAKRYPPLKNAKYLGKHPKGYDLYQYPHILHRRDNRNPHLPVLSQKQLDRAKYAIVLGETGAGKSTQINALVNYLQGVKIDDPFRYHLIVESTSHDQSKSQTTETNIYCVESQIGHDPLVLIDTPGYGDTRGMDKDHEIDKMLQDLFTNDVEMINLVCFVIRSTSIRLTATQNYVFNKVLTMFGKDIAENFLFILTFCDGSDPVIVKSLESSQIIAPLISSIKGDWYMRFNNSGIFEGFKKGNKMMEFYWDMCFTGMAEFMTKLNQTTEKSLRLSREVIRERKTLDAQIQGLQTTLKEGLNKVAFLEKVLDEVATKYITMKENANFVIDVDEPTVEKRQLPVGTFTTLCQECNRTCHLNCGVIPPNDKSGCCAMSNGYCTVCPKKCHHSSHINAEWEIVCGSKKVKVTQKELEARYKDAKTGHSAKEKVVYGLLDDVDYCTNQCLVIQEELRSSITKLDKIALRPNCFASTSEYIDQMIFNEKENKEKGWEDRVNALTELKKKNDLAESLIQNDQQAVFKPKLEMLQKLVKEGALTEPANKKKSKKAWYNIF